MRAVRARAESEPVDFRPKSDRPHICQSPEGKLPRNPQAQAANKWLQEGVFQPVRCGFDGGAALDKARCVRPSRRIGKPGTALIRNACSCRSDSPGWKACPDLPACRGSRACRHPAGLRPEVRRSAQERASRLATWVRPHPNWRNCRDPGQNGRRWSRRSNASLRLSSSQGSAPRALSPPPERQAVGRTQPQTQQIHRAGSAKASVLPSGYGPRCAFTCG